MSCGVSCARLLLIAFNFVFWLSGVGILGVGIWVLADPKLQDYIDVIETTDEEYFRKAVYIFIALGAFIFLVGFCGCCGAIRNSKCLLGFYIFFLVVVFAGELAGGILAAINKDTIIENFDEELSKSINVGYAKQAGPWDTVQEDLECCGGVSVEDYTNSTWQYDIQDPTILIPLSCCTLDDNGSPVDKTKCQSKVSDYHTIACKSALVKWVEDHSVILIGVGCGIAGLQIFGLVFAICLCRSLNNEKN